MKKWDGKEGLTLLIDADSLIYQVAHLETVEEAILKLDARIHGILEDNMTDKFVMFLTGKDCFRYSIAKSAPYKGNRAERPKPQWLSVITQYMVAKYKAVYYKGLEADDTVCYFKNKIPNSRICAIDKDVIASTEGTHYNYGMEKVPDTNPQEWRVKGFVTVTEDEANKALHLQALTGDAGDNILGCGHKETKVYGSKAKKAGESYEARVGVGPVQAEKILGSSGGNAQIILQAYMDMYPGPEGLCKFAETFRLVYMLRTDEDCMREVGYIPELPEIQTYMKPMIETPAEGEDLWG